MNLTPMMQQYKRIKAEHPEELLFFRLGDFYEMFFEDAEIASRELEIVLTSREGGRGKRIPMAGIPYHAAEGYIQRLLSKGYKVAICEQVEDPKKSKGLVRREIVRVITPGTVFEESLLKGGDSNFLVCLSRDGDRYGLARADCSTGEFAVTEVGSREGLLDEVARIGPAECLLSPEVAGELGVHLKEYSLTDLEDGPGYDEAKSRLLEQFKTQSLEGYGCEDLRAAVRAAGALLEYLGRTQRSGLGHIRSMRTYFAGNYLVIDRVARRNLELTERLSDGKREGSLLGVLDRTLTAMGRRTLKSWVERPLLDLERIRRRQEAIGTLCGEPWLLAQVRGILRGVYDLERLAGRVSYGTANARDLRAIHRSLEGAAELKEVLLDTGDEVLSALAGRLDPLPQLCRLIDTTLTDDPPTALTEGGLIRPGRDPEVDRLRQTGREGKGWIAALEAEERERTGIKSLKVGYNKVFGYYIEVSRPNLHLVPSDYIRKQTLANAERFITPGLKEKEQEVLGAEERLFKREYEIFLELREQVAAEIGALQATAAAVAEVDSLASLANAAVELNYVRPEVSDDVKISVRAGRHPVLETTSEKPFVPNDVEIDAAKRLLIITGPNMSGKSTYMRQVALIVIMAQMGSFVPARSARIGIADRIFTRIGASDDLSRGQSTFMVEMNEVANILNNATGRSLVILDEVGRGTSTYDGLSLARAISEHIATRVGARTLFATHYHELTGLAGELPGTVNLSVEVKEKGGEVLFLHRIIEGGSDRSYGIHVARLAGLPEEVLRRAEEILASLEGGPGVSRAQAAAAAERDRLPLEPARLQRELAAMDPNRMTPLDALNELARLKKLCEEG